MKISGAILLVKMLESNGVKFIFGVPGGHLLKFYDALFDSKQMTPILTKHESGASFMATGYAQVSGEIGVCTGTVGPGATNLTTGVASAYMDSIPLLAITAQVGTGALGKGGLQEGTGEGRTIDHVEIFNGFSKYATRIHTVSKLRETFRNAVRTAINGRPGPTHLDVMADVFTAETEIGEDAISEKIIRYSQAGQPEAIDKAADLILSSNNPAILAGAGAMEASDEVKELSGRYSIPVATTLRGKGIVPEDYELCIGCLGLYGTNIANKYLRSGIDVLLAVGTSFSEFTTHSWDPKFQPTTALIQIDVDSWEIGKNYPVSVGIIGDSKVVLTQLTKELKKRVEKKVFVKPQDIIELKHQREYFSDSTVMSEDAPIKPQQFMSHLRKVLPRDAIVFGDVGNNLAWIESFFQTYLPKTFFICSTLASMGYGVSASIGGQLAAPDKKIICICGDGDFQMQGMEVVTAVNYNLPVKWFIMNNRSLGMIRDLQKILFKGRIISSEFLNPDFVKLAEAMGATGYRISKPSEIEANVKEALGNGRPTIIDVLIDPNEIPSFDARAEAMVRAWGVSPSVYTKLKMIPEFLKRR